MLPDVGFGVYDTHVGLISSSIYQRSVVHLQEGIFRIVLRKRVSKRQKHKDFEAYWHMLACGRAFREWQNEELAVWPCM